MITFDHVTFTYEGRDVPVLRDVTLDVPPGELVLVVGPTGSGKSTLLQALNGLVPHFTGGTLAGRVTVAGRATSDHPPRELADVVGVVRQDPESGFVTDVVEDELAYTMESLGLSPAIMRRRVEETLDLLRLAPLRGRPLRSLSGGQRQRVAIGSVLTAHPQVLVLDEPTSALDPQAAEDVLAVLQRLVHDLGLTVVMSEHRLERVIQYADAVAIVRGDGTVAFHPDPAVAMRHTRLAPPLVELGRLAAWDPLPLSIRDARRLAGGMRAQLRQVTPLRPATGPVVAALRGVDLRYGAVRALADVDLAVRGGETLAVIGRNGAGKSTALQVLAGARRPTKGRVEVGGLDPADLSGRDLTSRVAFVPQEPATLLWAESVASECTTADLDCAAVDGTAAMLFARFAPGVPPETHPADLSEGTRLMLVLAIMLTADPELLLLDEPTRGLDYPAKRLLAGILAERARSGRAVVIATHDVEFIAEACDRVVMLADGSVVLDEDVRTAVTASPVFAPQVAKVMAPEPFLTVAEVRQAWPPVAEVERG